MKTNGIISQPTVNTELSPEPVNLAEAKIWLRISNDTENSIISLLIKSARIMLERYTGRFFKPVNITVRFKNQLGKGVLPYVANGAVTYDSTLNSDFSSLNDPYDASYTNPTGELKATYDTGYASLPEDLKTAILAQVAFMYFNRGDSKLSEESKAWASSYKVSWI